MIEWVGAQQCTSVSERSPDSSAMSQYRLATRTMAKTPHGGNCLFETINNKMQTKAKLTKEYQTVFSTRHVA